MKMLLISFGIAIVAAGCAADNETEESSNEAQTVASCEPDASFHAHGNRVCTAEGKTAVFGAANRSYVDHGTSKSCPGGEAVAIAFSCR
jgi:hypothetical protein